MPAPLGDALVWSGEDDPGDTLKPRLLACGADPKRVHFVRRVLEAEGSRPFDPAHDTPLLADVMERLKPALLIIDPIISAVAGDSHKNAETRRSLQPLVDLAAVHGCALLGITHLTKGTQGREPLERLNGSMAFGALARIVMLAFKVEDQEAQEGPSRRLVRCKSNVGVDNGGIGYDLVQVEVAPNVSASGVHWGAILEGNARELIAEAEAAPDDEDEGGDSLKTACDFLRDLLADGPVPSRQIKADADGAGYAWATVRRAASRVGVIKRKQGGTFGGKGAVWLWSLPAQDAHGTDDTKNMSILCSDEQLVQKPHAARLPEASQDAHLPQDAQGAHVAHVLEGEQLVSEIVELRL